jgi:acetyl-CoA acetyltransferase
VDPHYPGARNLSLAASAALAGTKAGVGAGPIEVAELCSLYTHEELLVREALGLGDDVVVNPTGGVLSTNPIGASGMLRFAEAALQVRGRASEHQVDGARLAPGHAYGGAAQ